MHESSQEHEPDESAYQYTTHNVTPLFGRIAPIRDLARVPPLTGDEIAEYRRLRPRLLAMLDGWDKVARGCPVARLTLGIDD